MPYLAESFNTIASDISVPAEVFEVNKGYPVVMTSKELTGCGSRVILTIIISQNSMGRIFMPAELTSTFTLIDMWEINSDRKEYKLYAREMAAGGTFHFQIERVA